MFATWTRAQCTTRQQGRVMKDRKRPPNLVLPPPPTLEKQPPETTARDWAGDLESQAEGFAVFCKKGRRRSTIMEDRYAVVLGIHGDPNQAFFGVFDGHGGPEAADFAAKNLQKNITNEVSSKANHENIKEVLKKGYLTTDRQFLERDLPGGACIVTAVVHGGDLAVSNAGDCRAVLSRAGAAEALTVDHKASLQEEQDRIAGEGGYVFECCGGVWRVDGVLAVSRAIGDSHLKRYVVAEPETFVSKIGSDFEFLIMASDGLWDNVGNQEAVDVVRSVCAADVEGHEALLSSCRKLVDLSVARGSSDDITVMIVDLSKFR